MNCNTGLYFLFHNIEGRMSLLACHEVIVLLAVIMSFNSQIMFCNISSKSFIHQQSSIHNGNEVFPVVGP